MDFVSEYMSMLDEIFREEYIILVQTDQEEVTEDDGSKYYCVKLYGFEPYSNHADICSVNFGITSKISPITA